jgi:hypothetical protein
MYLGVTSKYLKIVLENRIKIDGARISIHLAKGCVSDFSSWRIVSAKMLIAISESFVWNRIWPEIVTSWRKSLLKTDADGPIGIKKM